MQIRHRTVVLACLLSVATAFSCGGGPSARSGAPPAKRADLKRIEDMLRAKQIVHILLAVPEFVPVEGYAPKPPVGYVVPSKAALDAFKDKDAIVDQAGHWTEFAHKRMGNSLAEMIVGAPLICCARGPAPETP